MGKGTKSEKGDRGIYGKSVDKDTFVAIAEMIENGETRNYEACAAVCGLSQPTFLKRCCQYLGLVDEELPEWFLSGERAAGLYKKQPKLHDATQEEVDELKTEVERRINTKGRNVSDVKNAGDLPTL